MFEKILIATDLSPASDCLLKCAGELKNVGVRRIVLAHVIYVANTPGLEEVLDAEASPLLSRQKQVLEKAGFEVVAEMPVGIPARSIKDLADRRDVDAILTGSRGRGIIQRALLGSVAFKLLQISDKPVILARINLLGEGEACRFSLCKRMFEHILFPTDFSEAAGQAFFQLEKIAADLKGPVTLLHVQDPALLGPGLTDQQMREQRRMDQERLDSLGERLERLGAKVDTELICGNPREVILQQSDSGRYSLMAMGTQGKGLFREFALGSLAHEVACRAGLPVLFFPSRRP